MKYFIKNHGARCPDDWQRVGKFYRLSRKCGTFIFPEPVSCESEKISYRHIDNLISLDVAAKKIGHEKVFAALGRALADIHNEDGKANVDKVIVHGDFGLVNLAWSEQQMLPVIFDPIHAEFSPYKQSFGDRYFDLGQFVSTFFTPAFAGSYIFAGKMCFEKSVNAFLQSYSLVCSRSINTDKLLQFALIAHRLHFILRLKKRGPLFKAVAVWGIWLLRSMMKRKILCLTID